MAKGVAGKYQARRQAEANGWQSTLDILEELVGDGGSEERGGGGEEGGRGRGGGVGCSGGEEKDAKKCKECNSEGHDRRTCPQLGRGKAGSGRKKRGGAAGAASGAGSAAGGAADGVTGGDTTPGGNKAASKK